MTTALEEFDKEWQTYETDFEKAETEHLAYLRSYREMCTVQEGCAKNIKHLTYLRRQFGHDIDSFLKKGGLSEKEKNGLGAKKERAKQMSVKIAEMAREVPLRNNGLYLNIILGSNLNLTLPSPDERYRYKKEYESFKLSVACVILSVFFIISWLPPLFRVLDAFCNFLLVWYYCTLTIRESILRLNGSRIKGWWVLHHYITCVLCCITLTWSGGECYERMRPVFAVLVCYVSAVQIIQYKMNVDLKNRFLFMYKYQTGCLRRLHALGQRHSMDITVEGFSSWMFKGLTFLMPFLIVGYFIQAYCAFVLFDMYFHLNCSRDWQVIVLAFLFSLIAIGNGITIALVIVKKVTLKNRRESVSRLASKYRLKAL